jgi:small GTP-binding protein
MSEEIENEKEDIKVILLGEPGTGKTCLINVTVGEKFVDFTESTAGSTFVSKTFTRDDQDYVVDIWDTAGQEKYRALTKIFIKGSKIVIFVYAIDNKKSFDELKKYWINMTKDILGEETIYGIVGNKTDLYLNEEVKESEASEYAESLGMKFKTVSAKSEPGGFVQYLNELFDDYLEKNPDKTRSKSLLIDKNNLKKQKKNCC